jgi:hypothetical protein
MATIYYSTYYLFVKYIGEFFNILTPKCVPVGTNNSHSEDFLLVKHISHKHPHHDEPFSRLAAWFPWMKTPHLWDPLRKGLDKAAIKGFSIKLWVGASLGVRVAPVKM